MTNNSGGHPRPARFARASALREWAAELPRNWKRVFFIFFDIFALVAIVWVSFCIRFSAFFVPNAEQLLIILAAPAIALPVFVRMGLYRSVLRYLPERVIWTIVQAVSIATLIWVSLAFLTRMTGAEGIANHSRHLLGRERCRHRWQSFWREVAIVGAFSGATPDPADSYLWHWRCRDSVGKCAALNE